MSVQTVITIASIGLFFSCCLLPSSAEGQEPPITADGTTPTDINQSEDSAEINGGTQVGNNLFHSFRDFSIPNGGEAAFNNTENINNIISRVTGGRVSDIDGLIRANGAANLFLINPAGIIFGANASIDIGGSFLASSADSLIFPDGEFSATNIQTQPLLTINAPIGLGFRENAAAVEVRGSQLAVAPTQSLALVGGNISLDGANLLASDEIGRAHV